jgi:LPXTG-site transpeptidase (sortase) family protein
MDNTTHHSGDPAHLAHQAQQTHQAAGQFAEPVLRPAEPAGAPAATNPAADLIRQKLAAIYGEEPNAKTEVVAASTSQPPRSNHQQYLYELGRSGKNLSEIQAAWHQYYLSLDDAGKRAVWQEFYSGSQKTHTPQELIQTAQPTIGGQPPVTGVAVDAAETAGPNTDSPGYYGPGVPSHTYEPHVSSRPYADQQAAHQAQPILQPPQEPAPSRPTTPVSPLWPDAIRQPNSANPAQPAASAPGDSYHRTLAQPVASPPFESADDIRKHVRHRVGKRAGLRAKHHIQSLAFGLGFGALVVLIVLFSFFNEVVIAPFIQPSRHASATPIIIGNDSLSPTKKDEVIIPKLNLEIPLDFSANTIDEKQIENGLDNGIIHYPTTVLPGQNGNTAFFGHSSNNIFNPGKYKFAFVLLHELVPGDTFYLSYKGTLYAYTVYDKQVVDPTNVSVLNNVPGKSATAVLITCDPPGTSLKRLVVWGEQISPNPNGNATVAPTPTKSGAQTTLPGNGPTLWHRLWSNLGAGN